MPTPSSSVTFWAVPYGTSTVVAVGNVMIPTTDASAWLIATTGNRGTRRSEGIAVTSYGGSGLGTVEIWQVGTIDATISGLGAGSASWVRCSATGTIERFTPSVGGTSDVIGYAEADGRVHLAFGTWTETTAAGGGGASPGAPDKSLQYRVNGTTLGGDAYFTRELPGRININLDTTFVAPDQFGHGYFTVADPTDGADVTPTFGLVRVGMRRTDNGGFGSLTVVSGYSNTFGGVSIGAVGFSGGIVILGDAGGNSPVQIWGNGPGAGLTCVMGSSGFIYATGSNYSSLGGAGKFLAIDNAGKITVATPPATSPAGSTGDIQTNAGGGSFGGLTPTTTGKVLRATSASSAAFGAIDLANTNAVTGVLPIANGGTNTSGAPGTNAIIQYTGSNYATATNLTSDGTGLAVSSSGYIKMGTTPAVSGDLRHAAAATIQTFRNNANSGDLVAIASSADELFVGTSSGYASQAQSLRAYANALVVLGITSVNYLECQGSKVNTKQELDVCASAGGSSANSVAFSWTNVSINTTGGGIFTATAAQYSCPFITCTGHGASAATLVLPNRTGEVHWIFNGGTSGGLTVKVSGQTGVLIPTATPHAIVLCNGTDYTLYSLNA